MSQITVRKYPPHDGIIKQKLFMITSSNGNIFRIFRITGLLCGEFTIDRWIPAQRPVTRSFDNFSDLHLNQQLSKQWKRRLFETQSCSLWCNCNVPHYWPFIRGIYRLPVDSPQNGPVIQRFNFLLLFPLTKCCEVVGDLSCQWFEKPLCWSHWNDIFFYVELLAIVTLCADASAPSHAVLTYKAPS